MKCPFISYQIKLLKIKTRGVVLALPVGDENIRVPIVLFCACSYNVKNISGFKINTRKNGKSPIFLSMM